MRALADAARIRALLHALGRHADRQGRLFLTGGATAVLLGWRAATLDVDLKLVPDQDGVLRAIPALKDALQINVELAAPDQFIPVPDGWADRSPFVVQEGPLAVHHYDLTAQAMAKIERGHAQDVEDVRELLARGLVTPAGVRRMWSAIEGDLYRYPAVDPVAFEQAIARALGDATPRDSPGDSA